jgi:IS6 family transposase
MRARGLSVERTTVWRRVQRCAPEINRRMRPHLKMSGTAYRLDETCVEVGKAWKYSCRAADSTANTIGSMPSARRAVSAAKRFLKKLMRADRRRLPFTVGTEKHASYPGAFAASVKRKSCLSAAS